MTMSPRTTTRARDSLSTVASVSRSGSQRQHLAELADARARLVRERDGDEEDEQEGADREGEMSGRQGSAERAGRAGRRRSPRLHAVPAAAAIADTPMKTFDNASAPTVHSWRA